MAVATVNDVATSLGRPISEVSTAEQAQWEMWLGDAERQIRGRLGDVSLLDQDDLAFVEREAVVLKVKRPDAARTVSITVDDGTVSKTYDTGQVTILEEWWNLLSPNIQAAAFSTRPGFEPDNSDPYWPQDWS